MAEKTAMRQLLEWCEYRREKSATIHNASWNMIIAEIKDKYIELEKKQIIEAHDRGITCGQEEPFEQYYNETYKQD